MAKILLDLDLMATYFHKNFGAQIILWVKGSIQLINTTCMEDPFNTKFGKSPKLTYTKFPLWILKNPQV
jgi:hypothetical protein